MAKNSGGNQPGQGQSRKQQLRETRRREAQRAAEKQAQQRKQLMIIGAIAGVAVVVVLALILVNRDGGSDSSVPAVVAAPAPITAPTSGLSIGDPNAPVQIVEYGDYQCPYCGDFSRNGFPLMLEEFISTGQVHLTYVPMSFLGDESKLAAEAALCANDQGQFWLMHESIYNNQFGENQGAFTRGRLDTMAEKIELDMTAFKSCMDNHEQQGAVANQAAIAQQNGVSSTPTFIIANGEPVGWSNWAALRESILSALGG